jgi:hypothetical protein
MWEKKKNGAKILVWTIPIETRFFMRPTLNLGSKYFKCTLTTGSTSSPPFEQAHF